MTIDPRSYKVEIKKYRTYVNSLLKNVLYISAIVKDR